MVSSISMYRYTWAKRQLISRSLNKGNNKKMWHLIVLALRPQQAPFFQVKAALRYNPGTQQQINQSNLDIKIVSCLKML